MNYTRDFIIGAILGPKKKNKYKLFVIDYASRTLNRAQVNYTTIEKELLLVIFVLDKFQSHLIGSFTIVYYAYVIVRYLISKQNTKPRLI